MTFHISLVNDSTGSSISVPLSDAQLTALAASTTTPPPVVVPAPSRLACRAISTMKESRDTCRNQRAVPQIVQCVNLGAVLNVSHITVDCSYDYPLYVASWVAAVRATGKNVWFRCLWDAWRGFNGVAATMTPDQYLSRLPGFISANPGLFKPGDVFDACMEPEESPYWKSQSNNDAFNAFIVAGSATAADALAKAGISGVITGIRSTNQWWASHPEALYPATIAALGYCCYDSYPEGWSTDSAECAARRKADIAAVVAARPGVKLVIGEMGYSNEVNVSDVVQQVVLAAELAEVAKHPEVVGLNYWVGPGTDTSGGFTHIFSGSPGNWALRPAAATLAAFFKARA